MPARCGVARGCAACVRDGDADRPDCTSCGCRPARLTATIPHHHQRGPRCVPHPALWPTGRVDLHEQHRFYAARSCPSRRFDGPQGSRGRGRRARRSQLHGVGSLRRTKLRRRPTRRRASDLEVDAAWRPMRPISATDELRIPGRDASSNLRRSVSNCRANEDVPRAVELRGGPVSEFSQVREAATSRAAASVGA